MSVDRYEILVIGSGEAGKYLAWTLAKQGRRTALVERKMIGGSCPNVACLPSKNVIHAAKVASLAARATEFGLVGGPLATDMRGVQERKRKMVEALVQVHLGRYEAAGVDLIRGEARFVSAKTVSVSRTGAPARALAGDHVILSLGTRAAVPPVPGLAESMPMTHVEALELERLPEHLIVLGGGYVGLELAQGARRFGSRVTVIERGPRLAGREDPDVGDALLDLFRDEGIEVLLGSEARRVEGRSAEHLRVHVEGPSGERIVEGTDLLVAAGRTPNTDGIGLDQAGVGLEARGYVKVNERLETTAPVCGPWATAPAALSSRTRPSTTSASCATTSPAATARRRAGSSPSSCSPTRRWRASG
jgi:pyruvate/2-oxoglutarate dehydrogenase complex dihydrolipoamide dehydrogenase (E3) component